MRKLLLIIPILVLASASLFLLNRPKPVKIETKSTPKTVDSLFVYNPKKQIGTQNEPAFSIKFPDGWYRDLGVKGKERLLSFSPDKTTKEITYRAFITAGVAPTKLDLAGEVAKTRKEIGALAVNNKFITDKPVKIKGYPAHFLEYNTLLENDSQNVEQILGKSGLLIHHTDIITVKNGYFIDIAAYAFEWAWPELINIIEKSLNTISFNPK